MLWLRKGDRKENQRKRNVCRCKPLPGDDSVTVPAVVNCRVREIAIALVIYNNELQDFHKYNNQF